MMILTFGSVKGKLNPSCLHHPQTLSLTQGLLYLSLCSKKFETKSNLAEHVNDDHERSCAECEDDFSCLEPSHDSTSPSTSLGCQLVLFFIRSGRVCSPLIIFIPNFISDHDWQDIKWESVGLRSPLSRSSLIFGMTLENIMLTIIASWKLYRMTRMMALGKRRRLNFH